jgi:transposase InsO family protein
VVKKFPFRIRTIRTDRGHEFQALFHWHVADLGMEHVYIKPRTPQLNGKVERSHRTDKDEFYQLLTYRDDVVVGPAKLVPASELAWNRGEASELGPSIRGARGKTGITRASTQCTEMAA